MMITREKNNVNDELMKKNNLRKKEKKNRATKEGVNKETIDNN